MRDMRSCLLLSRTVVPSLTKRRSSVGYRRRSRNPSGNDAFNSISVLTFLFGSGSDEICGAAFHYDAGWRILANTGPVGTMLNKRSRGLWGAGRRPEGFNFARKGLDSVAPAKLRGMASYLPRQTSRHSARDLPVRRHNG